MTGRPAAGWYQDPTGQHSYRWWTGDAWSEQVRDAAASTEEIPADPTDTAPTADPAPTAPTAPTAPSPPIGHAAPPTAASLPTPDARVTSALGAFDVRLVAPPLLVLVASVLGWWSPYWRLLGEDYGLRFGWPLLAPAVMFGVAVWAAVLVHRRSPFGLLLGAGLFGAGAPRLLNAFEAIVWGDGRIFGRSGCCEVTLPLGDLLLAAAGLVLIWLGWSAWSESRSRAAARGATRP